MVLQLALAGLSLALPDTAAGWTAAGAASRYDARTIFDYIDGHGEVYLAYGMTTCLAQRYAGPPGEGDVVVDVFEMESPSGAYGVFTHSRDGDPAPFGQDASLAFGTLLFWKGRYFVSVSAERESERSARAVTSLARAVDEALAERGQEPPLVALLPREGLEARSIVWVRDAHVLDAHARIGRGNPLGVSATAPAVFARYARKVPAVNSGSPGGAELVLVAYPDEKAAQAALQAFAARYTRTDADAASPARPDGPRRQDDGWYAAAGTARGPVQAFVLRAASRELAESLLARVEKGLGR